MSTIGNSPSAVTTIRVEARKSFSLGLHVYDSAGRAADLSGCELTIVAKKDPEVLADSSNILLPNYLANIPTPRAGYALFALQASTLNVAPDEYEFSIVLKQSNGFTSVIVKGLLIVVQNTESASTGSTYSSVNPTLSLGVTLKPQSTVSVFVGGLLPPGMNYVRDEVMSVIESFDPHDIAYVPDGGRSGYVLTKLNGDDYAMEWRPVGNGQFSLDATGQPQGVMPVSLGDGSWTWTEAGINATGVADGYAPVSNGDGTWSWAQVTVATPNWTAAPGTAGEILNKPVLGSASAAASGDFISSNTLVTSMPGVHFQTTVPTSGIDGHLYFVYTP